MKLPPENKEEDIKKFFSSQSLIKLNEHELTEGVTSTQTVNVSQDVSFNPVSDGNSSQAYFKDWNLNPASKSVRESYLTPYAKPFTPKDTVIGGIMSVVTPHPEVTLLSVIICRNLKTKNQIVDGKRLPVLFRGVLTNW